MVLFTRSRVHTGVNTVNTVNTMPNFHHSPTKTTNYYG